MSRSFVFCLSLLSSLVYTSLAETSTAHANVNSMVEPRPVELARELKPHLGLMVGLGNAGGDVEYQSPDFGIDFGFQPYIPFSLGGEFSHAELSDRDTGRDFSRTLALVRAGYNFGGSVPLVNKSYVGAALGGALEANRYLLVSGPVMGFDAPIFNAPDSSNTLEQVSLGAMLKYLFAEGSSAEVFTVHAVAKAWF